MNALFAHVRPFGRHLAVRHRPRQVKAAKSLALQQNAIAIEGQHAFCTEDGSIRAHVADRELPTDKIRVRIVVAIDTLRYGVLTHSSEKLLNYFRNKVYT
jgi:hypothetical protein